jgi:erythromycin esterase-like protein
MSLDIRAFVPPSTSLLALGEPTHLEPACQRIRNEIFARLAADGFRSIVLETDRVAALVVNDFVQDGVGSLDAAMRDGFSHTFGDLDGNRELVAWIREYNRDLPPADRLAFHGFDAATEMVSAPSPRRYLEHARDYLGLDLDVAGLAGADERWSRTEAIMEASASVGATAEAGRLRTIADDMLVTLHARAPELIAATSRTAWSRAETHLTAGIGLLRYHRQAARPLEPNTRISRLHGIRCAVMVQNLRDIRRAEARRGPSLVHAGNLHLQRQESHWAVGDLDLRWYGAGAILTALGEPYTFIAGSLGRSEALGLAAPEPGTYEAFLQRGAGTWGLTAPAAVPPAETRTDPTPAQGYFPLDRATLDGADAVLHLTG